LQENDLRKALIPFIGVRYQKGANFISCLSRSAGLEGVPFFPDFRKTRHHELMIPLLVACLLDELAKE